MIDAFKLHESEKGNFIDFQNIIKEQVKNT